MVIRSVTRQEHLPHLDDVRHEGVLSLLHPPRDGGVLQGKPGAAAAGLTFETVDKRGCMRNCPSRTKLGGVQVKKAP